MPVSRKCSVAVHCLIFIHEYAPVKKVTGELLSLSTGCNPVTIRGVLSSLKKAGILSIPSGTGGATLARDPGSITLYQICQAVEPDALDHLLGIHSTGSPLCPVGRNIRPVLGFTYGKVQQDVAISLQGITLEQILEDYHSLSQE